MLRYNLAGKDSPTDTERVKGISSPAAGQADILVVLDLQSGNMLPRRLEYLGRQTAQALS